MKSFFVPIFQKIKNSLTSIRIAWIKYWALQRRFAFDNEPMSFRKAFVLFISGILAIYFLIGLPVLGYMIYVRNSEGVPLAIASALYPFPVATVGGDVILLKPYSDRLAYLKFFSKQTQQALPEGDALRKQVIDKLIDEAVIRQWAEKEGISVTRDDINAAYDKIIQDRGSESDVKTVLSQLYNLNDAEFKRLIPDLLYREKIERSLLERVRIKHILVSTETLAKKVKSEVTPENFDEQAKKYSEDKATRDAGGDLGYFDRARAEKLAPELAQVFWDLPTGQVSDPIKTAFGYHILVVTERSGKERKTFAQWLDEKRGQTKIRRLLK
ncbi:MAG TPA: peptidylprolyl isomerase [Patescibacteria group bacterium]